jgi:hypothetical protein
MVISVTLQVPAKGISFAAQEQWKPFRYHTDAQSL